MGGMDHGCKHCIWRCTSLKILLSNRYSWFYFLVFILILENIEKITVTSKQIARLLALFSSSFSFQMVGDW
jgi:hypothetical protein